MESPKGSSVDGFGRFRALKAQKSSVPKPGTLNHPVRLSLSTYMPLKYRAPFVPIPKNQ